jgi:hypothetical protein
VRTGVSPLTDLAVQVSRSEFLKMTHRFTQACIIRGWSAA